MDGHEEKRLLGTAEDGGVAVRCISLHPHSEQNQDQIQWEYLKAERTIMQTSAFMQWSTSYICSALFPDLTDIYKHILL